MQEENKKIKKQETSKITLLMGKISILSVQLYIITLFVFVYDVSKLFISQIAFLLMLTTTLLYAVLKNNYKKSPIYLHMIGIVLLSYASVLWAIDVNYALARALTVIQLAIMAIIIFWAIDSFQKIDLIINAIILGGIIMMIYSLYYYGIDNFINSLMGNIRLGGEINQENAFGFYCAIVFLLCLYRYIYIQKKIYLLFAGISILFSVSTGSRKSIVILLIILMILFYFKNKSNRIITIIVLALSIYGVFYILNYLGILGETFVRFTQFFAEKKDESTLLRMDYINFGIKKFLEKPILGYGIEQFAVLYSQEKGYFSPAHNNYIQILISFGIVGFIYWYKIYFNIIITCFKNIYNSNKNNMSILFFALILCMMTSEITTTTLINKFTYILISLSLSYISLLSNSNNKQSFIK